MSIAKRLMCAALAGVMLTASFAACANDQDEEKKPAETGSAATDDSNEMPEFIEADYDKEDFKILWGGPEGDYADAYIWSDGISGGAIGDAVLERNTLVEERYNVTVSAEECGPMGEAVTRMQAGQVDFDMIYEWGSRSVSAALDGMLYDFHDLPNTHFDRSYWVPWAVEELTVCDNLFIATNYITMNSFSWSGMLYFNKELMDYCNYTYPYDYVYSNSWTVDTYLAMITNSEEDVNGDGEMTLEDRYGVFGADPSAIIFNTPWYEVDADGNYTVIGYTESMVALYNEYKSKLDNASVFSYEDIWDQVDQSIAETPHMAARFAAFGENHCLFMTGYIDMTKELIDMQSDYGVCPEPKLDPDDEYTTGVDMNCRMLSLPVQLEDPEMAGAVIDYMAYESEQHLLPAYYDTTIKTKRMEDVRDYDMLDIIRTSISYDGLSFYGGNGVPRTAMLTSGAFASVWARHKTSAQKQLDDTIELLESLDY